MKYEGSKADNAKDKREAKAHGMTMKAWEGSPMDRKQDAAGQKAMEARVVSVKAHERTIMPKEKPMGRNRQGWRT